MKVNLGPYIHRWTITKFEDWYSQKRFGKFTFELEDSDYNKFDRFVEKFLDKWQTVLNLTINRYIDRKEREIKVHIDDYDVWSADHTLALIIHPVLVRLKEKKRGYPWVDDEDVPEELKSTNAPETKENEWDDNCAARWDWVLDEMIWAFGSMIDDESEDQFHSGEIDIKWTQVDQEGNEVGDDYDGVKLYRMDNGPNHTHVFDREAYEKYENRQTNGVRLFGKYYKGLWD